MKMFVVAALLVFGAVSAQAEGGDSNPWLSPEVLARQSAGLPTSARNAGEMGEVNPWENPESLNRQSEGVRHTGPGAAGHYAGCYTTYATLAKAQRACPPGVVAVRVSSISGRVGYTCQCAVDSDRGGNN